MVVWWPGPSSTMSLLALTILSVGSFACLQWVIHRWRWGLRPKGIAKAVCGILALEDMLQLVGWEGFRTSEIQGVWAAIANPNFLPAMCGMLAALVLARLCDSRYADAQRSAFCNGENLSRHGSPRI